MSNAKGVKDGLSKVGKTIPGLAFLGVVIPIVMPVADFIFNKAKIIKEEQKEELKDLVTIPVFYSKDISIKLDRAVTRIEEYGLRAEPLAVREATIKLKDCFDRQVLGTKPKHGKKVKPGTLVYVKYVTSNVIEKSQRLFEDAERCKAEKQSERIAKRAEQKEKAKKVIGDTATAIQHGAVEVKNNVKIKVEKRSTKRSKSKNMQVESTTTDA